MHFHLKLRLYLPRIPAVQFYEMAAKDKVCGNNLVTLKDLDLGAWIDRPGDVDCNDTKWIGAPDPADDHKVTPKNRLQFDPCSDPMAPGSVLYLMPFVWYVFGYALQLFYLAFYTLLYKRRFVNAPTVQPMVQLAADSA